MASFSGYIKQVYYARKKDIGGEPVYIQIIANRTSAFYPIGVRVNIKDWNFKKRQVRETHPDHRMLNALIKMEASRGQKLELELRLKGIPITAQRMKEAMSGRGQTDDLVKYIAKYISEIAVENKKRAGKYQRMLTLLTTYRKEISFFDLDIDFIRGFDRFLKTIPGRDKINLSINYVAKHHDYLKASINRAISDGVTKVVNPYSRFKIRREFVEVEYLSAEEFKKIESIPLVGEMAKARDFFLLATYLSGMRANELFRAKKSDLQTRELETGQSVTVLRQFVSKVQSEKRKVKYSIVIPKAMEIINKYPGEYLIPYPSNTGGSALSLVNKYLDNISRLAGVRPFTSKFARKILINRMHGLNMPASLIAQIVGHSTSQTTEKSYIAVNLGMQYQALNEAFK